MSEETKVVDDSQSNPPEVTPEPTDSDIDYKKKFSESSKEALRLLEEKKALEAKLEAERAERERLAEQGASHSNNPEDSLYPGFENLDREEQERLISYTNSIKQKALEDLYKDPAIADAKMTYNQRRWEQAFDEATFEYPELKDNKDDFKSKYYNANNVPDNIKDIIKDLSKIYLFDKARDLGAKEATEKLARIDIERANGGDKTPASSSRSLEDWNRMAQENPAQFAKMAKQFNEELASGKLK